MTEKTPLNVLDENEQKTDNTRVKAVVTTIGGDYRMVAHYVEQEEEDVERMLSKYSKQGLPIYKAELGAIYKKDIIRFLPLWVLYTVGVLLTMLSLVITKETTLGVLNAVKSTIGPLSVVNLGYALVAAQLLFGELFDPRLCNALHAMPVTRDLRYTGHVLAGLSFGIVPNLLISLVMTLVVGQWGLAGGLWLQAMILQYLFFFGAGVLSMYCTGNRIAAALVYGILNFGAMAVFWLADSILVPLLQGVALVGEDFVTCSPAMWMFTVGKFYEIRDVSSFRYEQYTFVLQEGWTYLWICGAVGVAGLVSALLLYRRRALEKAGDFMAVKALKPVFLMLYTLCIGAALGALGTLIDQKAYLGSLIVGLIVGFFTGKMFLERTVRVFQWKSFLQFGILAVVLAAVLLAAQWDPFGISRYVPDPEAVERVEVVTYDNGKRELKTSKKMQLKTLQTAHELALEEIGEAAQGETYYITYHMNDGRIYKRQYTVASDGKAAKKFQRLMAAPEAILGIDDDFDEYVRGITDVQITGLMLPIVDNYLSHDYGYYYDVTKAIYDDLQYYLYSVEDPKPGRYAVSIWRGEERLDFQVFKNSITERYLEAEQKDAAKRYYGMLTSFVVESGDRSKAINLEDNNAFLLGMICDACFEEDHEFGWEGDKENAVYVLKLRFDDQAEEKVFYISQTMRMIYPWFDGFMRDE